MDEIKSYLNTMIQKIDNQSLKPIEYCVLLEMISKMKAIEGEITVKETEWDTITLAWWLRSMLREK